MGRRCDQLTYMFTDLIDRITMRVITGYICSRLVYCVNVPALYYTSPSFSAPYYTSTYCAVPLQYAMYPLHPCIYYAPCTTLLHCVILPASYSVSALYCTPVLYYTPYTVLHPHCATPLHSTMFFLWAKLLNKATCTPRRVGKAQTMPAAM